MAGSMIETNQWKVGLTQLLNPITRSFHKLVKHTLKILQQMRVSDHFWAQPDIIGLIVFETRCAEKFEKF